MCLMRFTFTLQENHMMHTNANLIPTVVGITYYLMLFLAIKSTVNREFLLLLNIASVAYNIDN